MAWLFLLVAGLCEIAWAIGLKYTEGFSRLLPTIGTVAAMVASIGCLGLALQLPFVEISESMGNHDSKIVDAGSVD